MLLLDTHALIWLASDLSKLSENAKSAIRFYAPELYVSTVTALEISLLTERGRLDWGADAHSHYRRALKHHGVSELVIDSEIAWESARLPLIHRDPFDRIIIATAQKHKMTILTKDQVIPTYPKVKAVWE